MVATIADVADKAGVSAATASRALNGKGWGFGTKRESERSRLPELCRYRGGISFCRNRPGRSGRAFLVRPACESPSDPGTS